MTKLFVGKVATMASGMVVGAFALAISALPILAGELSDEALEAYCRGVARELQILREADEEFGIEGTDEKYEWWRERIDQSAALAISASRLSAMRYAFSSAGVRGKTETGLRGLHAPPSFMSKYLKCNRNYRVSCRRP